MKNITKALLVLIFIISGAKTINAQEDSVKTVTYDVVHLTKVGANTKGAWKIKGEILSFDEKDGGIVIKDNKERIFSLSRKEYEYFERGKVFVVQPKKIKVIKPRKAKNDFEYTIGAGLGHAAIYDSYTGDDYYNISAYDIIPVSLKIGAGKYLNESNLIGLTAEVSTNSYYNIGLRYLTQYGSDKRNTLFYNPFEVKYGSMTTKYYYDLEEIEYEGGEEYHSFVSKETEATLNTVSLNVGQGISFIRSNKNSLRLELLLYKHFILSHKIKNVPKELESNTTFKSLGAQINLLYGF